MKNKFKSALIPIMLLMAVLLLCACSGQTQFDKNDEAGYTVSVKFDANGGEFTTNCGEIVDSFNISGMKTNDQGMVELALISPDNTIRGANDTYTVLKNGYFLAGWYESRTETVAENGEVTYTYEGRWDFETDRLSVDPNKQYSSAQPELVLYAAWIPMYEIQFYDLETGELRNNYTFNPTGVSTINTPKWSEETGALEMYKFPKRTGYTFDGAFYDAAGTSPVGETVEIPAFEATDVITATKSSINVYVNWKEGEWYRIYTAKQFVENVNRAGCYELFADLDFTDVNWPNAFMYGEFTGKIVGNGHTISNVTITQGDNSKTRFGLFGSLAAGAVLEDITFQNITAVIQSGARTSGIAYGLFAGNISAEAVITDVQIQESQLQIDSSCILTSNDYVFGLLCGMGNYEAIDFSGITVVAVGDNPESVTIEVDETDGTLTVIIE